MSTIYFQNDRLKKYWYMLLTAWRFSHRHCYHCMGLCHAKQVHRSMNGMFYIDGCNHAYRLESHLLYPQRMLTYVWTRHLAHAVYAESILLLLNSKVTRHFPSSTRGVSSPYINLGIYIFLLATRWMYDRFEIFIPFCRFYHKSVKMPCNGGGKVVTHV